MSNYQFKVKAKNEDGSFVDSVADSLCISNERAVALKTAINKEIRLFATDKSRRSESAELDVIQATAVASAECLNPEELSYLMYHVTCKLFLQRLRRDPAEMLTQAYEGHQEVEVEVKIIKMKESAAASRRPHFGRRHRNGD